jgi:N-acetylneuraminic acid mutarotase
VACNDKIYVLGGMNRIQSGNELPSCDCYDPKIGMWQRIAPLPVEGENVPFCHAMCACVIGAHIYLFGGQYDDYLPTARVLMYDTISGQWSRRAPMPEARFFPECHAIGNDIYVLGGYCGSGKPTRTTWKYSTETDSWVSLADAPLDNGEIMFPLGKGDAACIVTVPMGQKAGELKYHVATDTWTNGGAGLPGLAQGHTRGCGVCMAWF